MSVRRLTAISASIALAVSMVVAAPAAFAAGIEAPSTHAVTFSGGTPVLSWDAVPGASGYQVQIATDPNFGSLQVLESVSTYARTYVPTAALGSTGAREVYWRVAAMESGLNVSTRGEFSEAEAILLDPLPVPAAVAPAEGSTVRYPAPVSFSWQPVRGAVSYTLQFSTDETFTDSNVLQQQVVAGTGFTPTEPLVRGTWFWRVRANFNDPRNVTVSSAWTPSIEFRADWLEEDSRVTLVSPANGTDPAVSDALFTWNPVPGARYYTLTLSRMSDFSQNKWDYQVYGTSFVLPTGLLDGEYYWKVVAHDLAGNAGADPVLEAGGFPRKFKRQWGANPERTLPPGQSTTAPVPLTGGLTAETAEELTIAELELAWEPVPRATFYRVLVTPLNGDKVLTCNTANTSATIIALTQQGSDQAHTVNGYGPCLWSTNVNERIKVGVTYQWSVQAIDYAGNQTTAITQAALPSDTLRTEESEIRYFRIVEDESVGGVDAIPDAAAWAAQAHKSQSPAPVFSWSPVEGADGYEVQVYRGAGTTVQVARFRTPSAKLRINGAFLDDNTNEPYYWRVRPLVLSSDTWSWTTGAAYTGTVANWGAADALDWQRVSTPVEVPPAESSVEKRHGSTLLKWTPHFVNAPHDGGTRGYLVEYRTQGTQTWTAVKVEYPFWMPQTTNGSPLPIGTYEFRVRVLDANGTAVGSTSAVRTFVNEPTKPSGLTSQRLAPTSVRVSWDASDVAELYQVRIRRDLGEWTTVSSVGQTAVTFSGLAGGGNYEWQVRARTKGNYYSDWSQHSFSTPLEAPTPLTAVDAVLSTSERVLRWQPVAGASRYLVQLHTSPTTVLTTSSFETTASSFAVPSSVSFGTDYYWRVTAIGERWTSSVTLGNRTVLGSSEPQRVSFRTLPQAPKQPKVSNSGKDITVSWDKLGTVEAGTNGPLQYVVRYRLAYQVPSAEWITLPPSTADATSKLVTGLIGGSEYDFQVSALSGEGQGPWSSIRTGVAATVPQAPTSVAVKPTTSSIVLSWRAPSGARTGGAPITGYQLKYRKAGASTWTSKSLGLVTKYEITGLTSGAEYEIELAAMNIVGKGVAATVTSRVLAVPSVPRSVTLKARDKSGTLKWKVPSTDGGNPITGYVVRYRAYKDKTWGPWTTRNVGADARSYKLSSLTNGTKYQVTVAAKTLAGEGKQSSALSMTPAGKPFAPKVTLKASKGKTKVTWTKAKTNGAKITKYHVYYSANGKKWKKVKSLSGSKRSYTSKAGKKGKKVYFRVVAQNKVGKSKPSTAVSVTKR